MKALDQEAINKISSGQVITGVIDAIKELIENALDANAKTIKIKIEDQGLKSLSVTDDGDGIAIEGRETCGHAYTTSKIVLFEDLTNDLTTYGFRGEALHSLCVVGDVTIITKCRTENTAIKMRLNNNGEIKEKSEIAAPFGTTVTVENLLSCFPVRVREERANFSAENLKNLLSKYFLAAPTIRFVVDAAPYVSTTRPPLTTLTQAVSFEFGSQAASELVERTAEGSAGDIKIRMKGIVPTFDSDWKIASTSRMQPKQLLLINGRPVKNSIIEKKINDTYWKKFGSIPKRLPRYVICIDFFRDTQLCSSMFDVNKDPSKSHIMFSESMTISKLIDEMLDFNNHKLKFVHLKCWPSTEMNISKTDNFDTLSNFIEFGDSSNVVWEEVGNMNNMTLFHAKTRNNTNINYLVAIETQSLLDACRDDGVDSHKMEPVDVVTSHWGNLMKHHAKEPCVFILGHVD